jgi:hypothetical protein
MVIARITNGSDKVMVKNVPSNIRELSLYLSQLRGRKILTFEETTTSQWLYVELKSYVDEILICDPYRNHLLSEGPKTDPLDAIRLAKLLKAGLLKPVFHSSDKLIELRKLMSGYEDMVKAGVRLKNQRSALLRASGKNKKDQTLKNTSEQFVLKGLDEGIENYEIQKERYEKQIEKLRAKHPTIKNLTEIFGIGSIGAAKIAARVVDAKRFKDKWHWLSYCGLVRHEKLSGGRSYGWKKTRFCPTLKSVFKTAAISVIMATPNPFNEYYRYLMLKKQYAQAQARNAVARRIAVVALAVMKHNRRFNPQILKK